MTNNELRKALYREKVPAILVGEETDADGNLVFTYKAVLDDDTPVEFVVPENDMGESIFETTVPAQLLWRWVVLKKQKEE